MISMAVLKQILPTIISIALVAGFLPSSAFAEDAIVSEGETDSAASDTPSVLDKDARTDYVDEEKAEVELELELDPSVDREELKDVECDSDDAVLVPRDSGHEVVPFASIVPGNGVTFPTGIVKPGNATHIGIDVSVHNGTIDWDKVKAAGVEFAIIRCGYGLDYAYQDDSQWRRNVSECERVGIPYGVYIYSYADSVSQAANEADHALRLLRHCGAWLRYPVYFDLEERFLESNRFAPLLGEMAMTFCSKISKAGYTPAIYANTNWFTNYLTEPIFDTWGRWVAQYNATCTYGKGAYQMWQCSSLGVVRGIGGNVDLNYELGYSNGSPQKTSGLKMVNGSVIFADGNGARKKGWQEYGGHTFYFDSNGVMVTGVRSINGVTYSFRGSGVLEGRWANSDNGWILLDRNGQKQYGWRYVGHNWYFLDGSSGVMQTGWLAQGGKKYYLNPSTGAMVTGDVVIDGHDYLFSGAGELVREKLPTWVCIGGKWYLRNSAGQNLTGWQKMGNTWYYMNANGVMQTGWIELGGVWYYLDSSGAMRTKWMQLDGRWYYLDPDSGAMAEGWAWIGGVRYYFERRSGVMVVGWKRIDGAWRYFSNSGAMKTHWLQIGNRWYYLAPDSGAMAEGWTWIGGVRYYFEPESGAMAKGWKFINEKWYYLGESGAIKTLWLQLNGKWYYLKPGSGEMAERWAWIGGAWYYFKPGSGDMVTGWTWIGGAFYYFFDSGAMAADQWVDGKYLTSSGALV